MKHAEQLKQLLRPLGVYDLEAPLNGGELESQGALLDEVMAALEELQTEADLTRARDWGLENWKQLFSLKPAAEDAEQMASSLAALMRIGDDSFTLSAIRDTLTGSGLPCDVEETGTGTVAVSFPGISGVPDGFEALSRAVEAILPAHLGIEYRFYYLVWQVLEGYGWTWRDVSALSWLKLERSVDLETLRTYHP